ncbi:MAG: hypothetical protein Q8K50_12635 [Hydrogenophaga sp.]|nr:hypothetical protein [Hydrogenophaga sp.]
MTTAAAPHAQAIPVAQMGPRLRSLTELQLVDHVQMVHNALGAVQSLTMPRRSDDGAFDDLHFLGQGNLSDLLEIINDRLATALEVEALRMTC